MFSLPVGTEMFHFPTFPPRTLCVQARVTGHDSSWVSPFGHPRITARLPTPRGLSQAPTSFIGSWCQGIHHVHLVACHYYKDARVHCVVLKQQPATPTTPRLPHPTLTRRATRNGSRKRKARTREPTPPATRTGYGLIPQDPTVCPPHPKAPTPRFHTSHPLEREQPVVLTEPSPTMA